MSIGDLQKLEESQMSITMVTTTRLPPYSVERYYMLSEIEQHGNAVLFMDDFDDNDEVDDSCESSDLKSCNNGSTKTTSKNKNIEHIILYMIWHPNMYHSPKAFAQAIEVDICKVLKYYGVKIPFFESESKQLLSPPNSPLPRQRRAKIKAAAQDSYNAYRPGSDTSNGSFYDDYDEYENVRIHLVIDKISPKPQPIMVHQVVSYENNVSFDEEEHGSDADDDDEYSDNNEDEMLSKDLMQNLREREETEKKALKQQQEEDEIEMRRNAEESHHKVEINIAEKLARTLTMSKTLRNVLQGVTIGITTEIRAAPALEAVLKCVQYGMKERRRLARKFGTDDVLANIQMNKRKSQTSAAATAHSHELSPQEILQKSSITIIAQNPDVFIGLDPNGETDAVQGIIQSVTCAEWNSNGNYMSFAKIAQDYWRRLLLNSDENKDSFGDREGIMEDNTDFEEATSALIVGFFFCTIAIFWFQYGETLTYFLRVFG